MMIGVAQVIGMKPILRVFFSIGPAPWAKTSVAVSIGKNCPSAAKRPAEPTERNSARRVVDCGNAARSTADATTLS